MTGNGAEAFPHPDRLLPPDPGLRQTARHLYQAVSGLPVVSPHGHVDASLLADDKPFDNPVDLLVRPDHYVLRLLHSQGVGFEELGVAPKPGAGERAGEGGGAPVAGPRQVWGQLCRHWPAFRGTVMRLWLETTLADLFGVHRPLDEPHSDETYDAITEQLGEPGMRPRALYHRFGLELLATTDAPTDDLAAHRALRQDPTWQGRVVPTFRPDVLTDPTRTSDWGRQLDQLEAVSGTSTATYKGYVAALEARRAAFAAMGATSTDHGHVSADAMGLSADQAARLYDRLRSRPYDPADAAVFRSHMLMEMARMSADDGLVMQLHPGAFRSHDAGALALYGPDLGADFPVATTFTAGLAELLSRFGSSGQFRAVAFTMDETTYSRELAPLASYYPNLWLGAPWWFLDAPDAMARAWSATVESAGFSKLAGFVDDTRAYCSVPARHDLARRAFCGFVSRIVHEHRLRLADAEELVVDFAYRSPRQAFRLTGAHA